MQPGPDARLLAHLAHLPDACRAILSALERQAARGGGEVVARLQVTQQGEVEAVEVSARYGRRTGNGTA